MKAVVHERFGAPRDVLVFGDVPEPARGPDDVVVGVRAVGVAISDWLIARGLPYVARPSYGITKPKQRIAGLEFAGVVETVGSSVTRFRNGDEVFGWGAGALAERIAVRGDAVVMKPTDLSFEEAAAVPISGFAALQAVRDAGGVGSDDHVLLIGASGAVGTLAVQIAKAIATEVTAVCGTANVDLVRSIGADRVIDYTKEQIGASDVRYDVILDIAGNRKVAELRRALSPTGTLVIVGGSGGPVTMGFGRTVGAVLRSPFVRQRLRTILSKPNAEDLLTLAGMLEARQVTPIVDRTFPLDAAADAIAHVGGRSGGGKTVVTV